MAPITRHLIIPVIIFLLVWEYGENDGRREDEINFKIDSPLFCDSLRLIRRIDHLSLGLSKVRVIGGLRDKFFTRIRGF